MASFMRTDHDHRGFTLIELMMAIASPQYFTYIATTNGQGAVVSVHLIVSATANAFATAHNGQASTAYTSVNGQVTDDMAGLRQAPIFAVLLTRFGKWLYQWPNSIVQVTNGTAP